MSDAPKPDPSADELSPGEALAYAIRLHREDRVEAAAALYRRILEVVPECAEALNFLGVAESQLGHPALGAELIARSIAIEPEYADAYNNLGNVLKKAGRLSEAAAAYRRVLELRPDAADALSNLATVLGAVGRHREAAEACRRALAAQPDHVAAYHNLGTALTQLGEIAEGLSAYRKAISLRPYDATSYRRLGTALQSAGRVAEAVDVYRKWLEVDPGDAEARHYLAACSGEGVPGRASDDFVRQTFDRLAETFDEVLLGRLHYRAPDLVAGAIRDFLGDADASLDVLDAGCGTGLCGATLRAYARRLVGVDLSDEMLVRAKQRGFYDELVKEDLVRHLQALPEAYDVIVSADTLVYFGDLSAMLRASAKSLRAGGAIAFTLERAESEDAQDGFRLNPHGRYSHSERYVRSVLATAPLDVRSIDYAELRTEGALGVQGLVVTASRSSR
jgi:predicted TPR repeat methyltransferase